VYADANPSAPQQNIPQPQYIIDGSGSEPNTFATLSAALADGDVTAGSMIGIKGSATITESSQVNVDESVTITGFEGTPTLDVTAGGAQITADGVDLRNVELKTGTNRVNIKGDNVSADGISVTFENQGIYVKGSGGVSGVTIQNSQFTLPNGTESNGYGIRFGAGTSNCVARNNAFTDIFDSASGEFGNGIVVTDQDGHEIVGNLFSGNSIGVNVGSGTGVAEKLSVSDNTFSSHRSFAVALNHVDNGSVDFDVTGNSFDADATGILSLAGGSIDVSNNDFSNYADTDPYVDDSGGVLDLDAVANDQGNTFTPDAVAGNTKITVAPDQNEVLNVDQLTYEADIQTAIDNANTGGETIAVGPGSYTGSVSVATSDLTLKGVADPTIEGDGTTTGSRPHAAIHVEATTIKSTVEGFTVRNPDGYYGIYVGSGSGSQDIDQNQVIGNTIEKISTNVTDFSSPSPVAGGAAGVYVRGNHDNSVAVEDNVIQDVDTTGGSGVNATGISFKSFTDDDAAKGASVQNNLIKDVAGSGRNKGISVNGDYDGAKVIGNTINGLTGDSNAAALKAITINQNKSFAPTADPDGDGSDEWVGPVNFQVNKNEISQVNGVSDNSWGIAIGNYEELDSTVSNYGTGQSSYKGVENNNVFDTNLAVGIGRYNLDKGGVNPADTDTVVVDGNYYGDADGPTGKDVDGALPGDDGALVGTVGGDTNGERVDVKNFSSSENSDAGSSL